MDLLPKRLAPKFHESFNSVEFLSLPIGETCYRFLCVGLLETKLFKGVISILLVMGNNLEYGKETEKERGKEVREQAT